MQDTVITSYLKIEQAAEMCGMHRTSLYYYLKKQNGPPHVMIAGRHFFEPKALSEWNQQRKLRTERRKRSD